VRRALGAVGLFGGLALAYFGATLVLVIISALDGSALTVRNLFTDLAESEGQFMDLHTPPVRITRARLDAPAHGLTFRLSQLGMVSTARSRHFEYRIFPQVSHGRGIIDWDICRVEVWRFGKRVETLATAVDDRLAMTLAEQHAGQVVAGLVPVPGRPLTANDAVRRIRQIVEAADAGDDAADPLDLIRELLTRVRT
jgi:hypothetical protein